MPGEDVHFAVESRREQQPLALRRGGLEQPTDLRQEPQVGHLVGFIARRAGRRPGSDVAR
jgi:hypothetical protein